MEGDRSRGSATDLNSAVHDREALIGRIELTVCRDLQYIRIDGTIVGRVGLIIFAVTQLF
jgi:uncharacterized membrane-anchored protein YjiN (DUF445 family)